MVEEKSGGSAGQGPGRDRVPEAWKKPCVQPPEGARKTVYIALVSVFSALAAALTFLLRVPSPTGGYTHIGDTAIYVAAALFGPYVGLGVGLIGPAAADLLVGYPRWYVTLVAHGLQGYIAGLGRGRGFAVQVALMVLGGAVMSLTYFVVNVYLKGLPLALASLVRDFFGQTLVSVVIAAIIVRVLRDNPYVKKALWFLGEA